MIEEEGRARRRAVLEHQQTYQEQYTTAWRHAQLLSEGIDPHDYKQMISINRSDYLERQ